MKRLACILASALTLAGCAAALGPTSDPAISVRLLDQAVAAANHQQAAEAAQPADQTAAPSELKLTLTVDGPDEGDAAQTAPPPAASCDEPEVPAEPVAANVDEAPPAEPQHAAAAVVSDQPPASEQPRSIQEPLEQGAAVADEPGHVPGIVDAPRVETIERPINAREADSLDVPGDTASAKPPLALETETMEQAEEVVTPQPAPPSRFKQGADETGIDRFQRQVTDVPIDIRPTAGDLPEDLAARRYGDEPLIDQTWPGDEPADIFCSYTPWTICYRPLYFEDLPLERYGENVGCLQTGLSGVKFFGSIAALPYKMTVRPPRSCQCSNGFSRCGDCPLPGYGRREFRLDASLIEAAAVAGVVYILP